MPKTARKVLATAMLLVLVPLYALLVLAIAGAHRSGASILVQTIFFAVTGILWIFPAGAIIAWMRKP